MIGNVVGNYKILEKIGEGGMGTVFRGVDLMLEREVAIKALRPELSRQPDIVERFRTEAITLAKLNHPNIATLYSFLRQGDDFFMVMEFVTGETLDRRIHRAGAMRTEEAIPLFCQALEGIDHAHRLGIVHRDIKPANMMLTSAGSIKVMDFGIARVLGSARMTKQGNIIGTLEYMSPEQVRGMETDARSDIYSLGILLYEMITGRVPFTSDSEFELMRAQIETLPQRPTFFVRDVPGNVEAALMRALAKDAAIRFQSAAELRRALVAGTPVASTGAASAPAGRSFEPSVPRSIPGETRLAAAPISNQVDAKETRLAGAQGASPAHAHVSPMAQEMEEAPFKPGWKYFAAAAGLVLLVGVTFTLWLGSRSPAPTPVARPVVSSPPVVQSPPPPQSPNPPPASAGGQSQHAQEQVPAIDRGDSNTILENSQPISTESPGVSNASRTRRKDPSAEAKEKERRRKAAEQALDKP